MSEENNETPETEVAEEVTETETVDLSAEVDKWKALSRKNEQQAKANAQAAKELEELKRESLTEQERLIESTREDTRKTVRMEFAAKLVEAELKSELNGRVLEGNAIVGFDKTAFIDENGDIDTEAISAWVEAHTKTVEPTMPDLGQGLRGKTLSGSTQIRSREDLSNMSNSEILAARKDGRLDVLLGKN
jgi:hypothetical protein